VPEVAFMKRITYTAICLLLVTLVLGASGCDSLSPPSRTSLGEGVSSQNTGIWVSGEGKVTVVPDIAILQVGVEAEEDTVAEAMNRATIAMANIGTALIERGVKSEDIQTQYFNIRQRTTWDSQTDEEVVTGYRVTNKAIVKIRVEPYESSTLDYKASNIVDAVVSAGGDLIRIDNLSFTVEDPTEYYDEAREKATADAKAKAEKLAKQTGVKLGGPTFVSESAYTPSTYGGMNYGLSAPVPAPVIIESAPPTSLGEIEIVLTVQVAYAIN
jgi:uncharacterized protein YggE